MAASAKRGQKQLIGIIIGTSSSSERAKKMIGLFDDAFKAIPKRKKFTKLTPLKLAKINSTRKITAVTVPLAKPRSFEDMLKSQGKEKVDKLYKNPNQTSTKSVRRNNVNVQIGMYTTLVSAERDMPNILLLNIDLLADIDNESIKIRKNKEKKYSIFVNEITYALAENLCVRTQSQETTCSILAN